MASATPGGRLRSPARLTHRILVHVLVVCVVVPHGVLPSAGAMLLVEGVVALGVLRVEARPHARERALEVPHAYVARRGQATISAPRLRGLGQRHPAASTSVAGEQRRAGFAHWAHGRLLQQGLQVRAGEARGAVGDEPHLGLADLSPQPRLLAVHLQLPLQEGHPRASPRQRHIQPLREAAQRGLIQLPRHVRSPDQQHLVARRSVGALQARQELVFHAPR
mmetsp:Transcript_20331/g.57516  ORF Transcript_20331/g.57516 Transcript_20331/m.57516 type:complete len:222 (-) Transcript_20331:377-1042(-)